MTRILRFLLLTAFVVPVAAPPSLASDAELIRRWEFKTPADAAGWTPGGDVQSLAVLEGSLRIVMNGPDAYVFAPPLDVPLDGCLIRVRMRCNRDGGSQIYWTTSDDPEFSERQVLSLPTPGVPTSETGAKEAFATYDFPIGRNAPAGRRLTRFRIDPYNNNPAATAEIQSVELLRQQAVLDVLFSTTSHWVEVGKPVSARVSLRHVAGRTPDGRFEVTLPGGHTVRAAAQRTAPPPAIELVFDRPGVQSARAAVATPDGKPLYDLETSAIVGKSDALPIAASIRSEHTRIDLIPSADSRSVGAARWMTTDATGNWKLAGWLLPLAEITVEHPDGQIVRRRPALQIASRGDDRVELRGTLDDPGGKLHIRLACAISQAPPVPGRQVAINAELSGAAGVRILDFSAPVLLVDRDPPPDPLDRFALFGGLEFLEPGWPSSSDRAVGELFAERWSPFPHKITLPAMAVETAGLTTAMMWPPQASPAMPEAMPAATFASPNFLDGQPNHLMTLSAPAGPKWRQENESRARTPYIANGDTLRLTCVLHTEPGLPAAMVARRWYETFGPPAHAPPLHDDKTLYDIIARNFGETMWWPDEKAWHHHWYVPEPKGSYAPDMAAEIIAHSVKTGEKQWVRRTGLEGRAIIDAAGTLARRLADDARPKALIASMRPDGTWPFINTPRMREQARQFTQGKHDSLGEDGSTTLGTCVQAALPILHYAELSGDPKCTEAGLKALEAMRRFRVPRGAQVWEVHQDIPDIRAAALAVEAYHTGYCLTGDKQWLEDANYWGWAGVPFVYSWRGADDDTLAGRMIASRDKNDPNRTTLPLSEGCENPARRVRPYATVPVLGPTFYVVNWFGVVVQWCGLEWAQHVIELDADSPDPLLRYIADGVVGSGLQQMFDKPPWAGLYPDVWDIQQNTAQGAFIYAGLPLRCLRAQGRVPPWTKTWTRVLRDELGRMQWHVSGWGSPPQQLPAPNPVVWSVRLAYPPGQPNELLIAGVPAPRRVRIGDAILEAPTPATSPSPTADTAVAHAGAAWRCVSEKDAVVIRFTSPREGETDVRVEW